MESVEELETANPVKPLGHVGDTDNGDRIGEIQLRNANIHKVERKRTGIGAAQSHLAHRNAATLQAVFFVKD
jgi:hypothetical protein